MSQISKNERLWQKAAELSSNTYLFYFNIILLWFICLCGVFDGCGGWPTTSYLCQLCWPVGTTYMYNPPMHYNTIFTISCTVITTNRYTRASCLPPLSDRLSQKTPELGHRSFFCGLDRGLMGLWWNYYTSPSWHRQINPSLFEIIQHTDWMLATRCTLVECLNTERNPKDFNCN